MIKFSFSKERKVQGSPPPIYFRASVCSFAHKPHGGAENDGHENDGPSKCPGMKLTDMKMQECQDMFQVSE